MKDKVIKTENITEYAAIVSLLLSNKYSHFSARSFETLTKEWGSGMMRGYSWVCVDLREDTFCGYKKDAEFYGDKEILTFAEGLAFLTNPQPKTGKINIGDYKACVYDAKKVNVGCQTILFETVENLYNVMKALKN
jgi:hypothetical protein